jgi:hypothetical protein
MADPTRTPEHENLEVVFVGSFNPAIFHPQWLSRYALVGEVEAEQAVVKAVSAEVSDVRIGGFRLLCLQDRLSLSTQNVAFAEKLYDLAMGIFSLLPHIPLTACGVNSRAHYKIESIEYWHKIGHQLAPKDTIWNALFEEPGMNGISIKAPRTDGQNGEFNVFVEPSRRLKPGIHIQVNSHLNISEDDTTRGNGASIVKNFLEKEWKTACAEARRVACQIFATIKQND